MGIPAESASKAVGISIDPILSLPGLRQALADTRAPVIAVSPIIAGEAVKGPTAKLMIELGIPVNVQSIARHYEGLIDGMLTDDRDSGVALPIKTARSDILMHSLEDRIRVATAALALADDIAVARGRMTGA